MEKMLFACALFFSCGKFLLTHKPALVHIHFSSGIEFIKHSICLIVARVLGFKIIFHLHGGNFENFYISYHPIAQKTIQLVLRIPHRVIALSDYWARFLSTIMDPKRLIVINNPIDCERFSPPCGKAKNDMLFRILLLGRLGKHKGHYDAVKALLIVLNKYSNVVMLFAGNDDALGETENLKKITEENGIATNVQFLGPVTGEAKEQLLYSCSIMILPSCAENMPLSILEGMAAKLPVIATCVGAIPELLENGKLGILIQVGNYEALAEGIIQLIENPQLRETFSQQARNKICAMYDIKKIARDIDKVYCEVLNMATNIPPSSGGAQ